MHSLVSNRLKHNIDARLKKQCVFVPRISEPVPVAAWYGMVPVQCHTDTRYSSHASLTGMQKKIIYLFCFL